MDHGEVPVIKERRKGIKMELLKTSYSTTEEQPKLEETRLSIL